MARYYAGPTLQASATHARQREALGQAGQI